LGAIKSAVSLRILSQASNLKEWIIAHALTDYCSTWRTPNENFDSRLIRELAVEVRGLELGGGASYAASSIAQLGDGEQAVASTDANLRGFLGLTTRIAEIWGMGISRRIIAGHFSATLGENWVGRISFGTVSELMHDPISMSWRK
jgi:hypothetical protein